MENKQKLMQTKAEAIKNQEKLSQYIKDINSQMERNNNDLKNKFEMNRSIMSKSNLSRSVASNNAGQTPMRLAVPGQ